MCSEEASSAQNGLVRAARCQLNGVEQMKPGPRAWDVDEALILLFAKVSAN